MVLVPQDQCHLLRILQREVRHTLVRDLERSNPVPAATQLLQSRLRRVEMLLDRFAATLADISKIESPATREGRNRMNMVLTKK